MGVERLRMRVRMHQLQLADMANIQRVALANG